MIVQALPENNRDREIITTRGTKNIFRIDPLQEEIWIVQFTHKEPNILHNKQALRTIDTWLVGLWRVTK
jgi:hypothetical protein